MQRGAATDLEYMIGLGHAEADVKEALRLANGNRNAALYILVRGGVTRQTAWRQECPEDWTNGIVALPNLPENRALHKSPVYVFIGQFWPTDDGVDYVYNNKVTLKDGREWVVKKSYSDFVAFYRSLPYGTCSSFKNSFPSPSITSFIFGDLSKQELVDRQTALQEWIRELCTSEVCMTNTKVLEALYLFVEAHAHGGRSGFKLDATPDAATRLPTTAAVSPLLQNLKSSSETAVLKRRQSYIARANLVDTELLPLPLKLVQELVPFKVDVRKLHCFGELLEMKSSQFIRRLFEAADIYGSAVSAEESAHGLTEIDFDQLRKDCRRDRFVVQGRRIEGSLVDVEAIIQRCTASICEAITASGRNIDLNTSSPRAVNPFDEDMAPTAIPLVEATAVHDCVSVASPAATTGAVARPSSSGNEGGGKLSGTVCRPPRNPFEDDATAEATRGSTATSPQGETFEGTACLPPAVASATKQSVGNPFEDEHDPVPETLNVAGSEGKGTVCAQKEKPFTAAEEDYSPQPASQRLTGYAPLAQQEEQKEILQDEELWQVWQEEIEEDTELARAIKESLAVHTLPDSVRARSFSVPTANGERTVRQSCDALSTAVLHAISRTESAYLSHASLHDLLDMTNLHNVPGFQPYLFVPESGLAEPLCLQFSVLERNGNAKNVSSKFAKPGSAADEWCVECQGETSTVYRLLDAASMQLIVQLRVTFLITQYGMPTVTTEAGRNSCAVTALAMKEGKCQLIVDRMTTTTARDWGNQSLV
jgi:hypothetical protein